MVCEVLSGSFAYLLQIGLGLTAVFSLIVKHNCEHNRRPWGVWLKDASKQLVSAIVSHLINLYFASELNLSSDQCVAYFVNFVAQNILGLFLNYFLHRLSLLCAQYFRLNWLESGRYETNKAWLAQLSLWTIITFSSNMVVFFAFVRPLESQLVAAAAWLLHALHATSSPNLELIVVMCIVPLLLDILQFCVQDAFLKFSGGHQVGIP